MEKNLRVSASGCGGRIAPSKDIGIVGGSGIWAGGRPDGTVSTTSYDDANRLYAALDELGHKTVYVVDLLGRLNETREFYTSTSFYGTKVAYDAMGQTITVRRSNNEVTRMCYDSLGRETSVAYPDSKSESYTYDDAGRILTATSRSGSVTSTFYDASGDPILVSGTSGSVRTWYDCEGLVVNRSNSLGYISYRYDGRDLVSSLTERIDSCTYTFGYHYNAVGDVDYVDYPDGKRVAYSYDHYGRLTDMRTGSAPLLNVTYLADDSISTERYGNSNSTMSYWYNSRGLVQEIKGRTYSNAVVVDLFYSYYADGDVQSIRDTAGSAGNEYYWYDQLGRITKAMANSSFGTIMYGYTSNGVGDRAWKNDAGNNKSCTYTTYSKITSDGTWTYTHDSDGNVIFKEIALSVRYNYTYDSFGRMTAVKKQLWSGGTWGASTTLASYYYDANGARAKTVEGAYTNRTVYNGHDPFYEVSSADGKGWKYLYLGSKLELRVVSTNEKQSYACDALGSVRMVLNNGDFYAPLFTARTYKPFGAPVTTTGSSRMSYASEIRDTPSGLYYLSARYYDPELGRFYALDPELGKVSQPQTLDRYVYCGNNPLIRTDPTGRFWNIILGAVIGAAISAVVSIATQVAAGGFGNIDWGIVATDAVIGAATGALAAATFGACAVAANTGSKALSTSMPRLAKGVELAGKALGAFSSGSAGSVVDDALHNRQVDTGKAMFSGALSVGSWLARPIAGSIGKVTGISGVVSEKAPWLSKPLVSQRLLVPNSETHWDGWLFSSNKAGEGFAVVPDPATILWQTGGGIAKTALVKSFVGA